MIISKHNGTLRLVRQDLHAVHSGEVAKMWGNGKFKKTLSHESVKTAISLHDIGWKEVDDEVLLNAETGSPVNFMEVNLKQHVDFYRKGFLKVSEVDPQAGLLVGMHWIGLYTSRFGYDPTFTYKTPPELVSFMNSTVKNEQEKWIEIKERLWSKNGMRSEFEDTLWMQYELVQVMDRISQVMSITDTDHKSEVQLGPIRTNLKEDHVKLTVKTIGNGKISVAPFPFEAEFDANVPCKIIPDNKYESHDELISVINDEKQQYVNWRVVPG